MAYRTAMIQITVRKGRRELPTAGGRNCLIAYRAPENVEDRPQNGHAPLLLANGSKARILLKKSVLLGA